MPKITIKDVAKAANVSISTVSKVMNNAPSISEATKAKVKAIMEELHYYPNNIARSFAQQSSKNIGVVMKLKRHYAFFNSHIYEILGGIESILSQKGYTLTLLNTDSLGQDLEAYERLIHEKRVDGMIIYVSHISQKLCEYMDTVNFPYIVIGEPDFDSNLCWIDINNKSAGEIAANHLIDEGYTHIGFIGNTQKDNISYNREKGIRLALEKRHIPIYEEYMMQHSEPAQFAESLVDQLVSLPTPPDALICLNNFVANKVISALKKHNLRIPEDIALMSFDNYPLAEFTTPPLTVVDNDVFDLGTHAANILLNKIDNPNLQMQYSMLSPTLIVRSSSKKH